jgi:N-acetylglucosaminyldiphosphoundecaprenol N-acetyl-beta-D-mannosaminyltransferase
LPDDLAREVYCVLGLPIDVIDMAEALRRIEVAAAGSAPYLISTPNLNFLVNSRHDAEFRESVIQSDLCPPDGMPIVWIARMMGLPISERVAGSDIFDSLKRRYAAAPLKTFLFGGAAGIAAMVANALNAKPLGLSCVGSLYPGYGTVDRMSSDDILETINRSRADFLAVALSAAKGQAWLHRNRGRLQVPIRAQLGAAINFQAGTVTRAPALAQKLGLEWLWRIKEEPQLWKRYAHDGLSLLKLLLTRVLPLATIDRWQRLTAGSGDRDLQIDGLQTERAFVLRLAGAATAACVEPAAARLREAIAASGTVALDLSATSRIDARFLGLLLMARKVTAGRGGRLIITRVSHNTKRLFRLNGADFLLSEDRGSSY